MMELFKIGKSTKLWDKFMSRLTSPQQKITHALRYTVAGTVYYGVLFTLFEDTLLVSVEAVWVVLLLLFCSAPYKIVVIGTQCCLVNVENAILCLLDVMSSATNKALRSQLHVSCAVAETVPWGVWTLRRRFDLKWGFPQLLDCCCVPVSSKLQSARSRFYTLLNVFWCVGCCVFSETNKALRADAHHLLL